MRVAREEEGRRRVSSEHPSWALGIIWLCEAAPDTAGGVSRAGVTLPGDCGPYTSVQVMGRREGQDPPGPFVLAAESVMVQERTLCVCVHTRVCAYTCVHVHVCIAGVLVSLSADCQHSSRAGALSQSFVPLCQHHPGAAPSSGVLLPATPAHPTEVRQVPGVPVLSRT